MQHDRPHRQNPCRVSIIMVMFLQYYLRRLQAMSVREISDNTMAMRPYPLIFSLLLILAVGCGEPLGFEHRARIAQYPQDWEDFKKSMNIPLIQIPGEAEVTSLKLGEGTFGVSIQISFTLPDSKSPPQWLCYIALQSRSPNRVPRYLQHNRYVEMKEYDSIPVEEAKQKEWAIGFHDSLFNGGYLRYLNGNYSYIWSND